MTITLNTNDNKIYIRYFCLSFICCILSIIFPFYYGLEKFWGYFPVLSYLSLFVCATFCRGRSKELSFFWTSIGVSIAVFISFLLPIISIHIFDSEFHWGFVLLAYPILALLFGYLGWIHGL